MTKEDSLVLGSNGLNFKPRILGLVAGVAKNGAIGKRGNLVIKSKEDLEFFKRLTLNNPIIMGRKTFKSLPGILPGRLHVVITRTTPMGEPPENVVFAYSLPEALSKVKEYERAFIIGGGQIYAEALKLNVVDEMYLTHFDQEVEGTVFFPEFDESLWNKEHIKTSTTEPKFEIIKYKRRDLWNL